MARLGRNRLALPGPRSQPAPIAIPVFPQACLQMHVNALRRQNAAAAGCRSILLLCMCTTRRLVHAAVSACQDVQQPTNRRDSECKLACMNRGRSMHTVCVTGTNAHSVWPPVACSLISPLAAARLRGDCRRVVWCIYIRLQIQKQTFNSRCRLQTYRLPAPPGNSFLEYPSQHICWICCRSSTLPSLLLIVLTVPFGSEHRSAFASHLVECLPVRRPADVLPP